MYEYEYVEATAFISYEFILLRSKSRMRLCALGAKIPYQKGPCYPTILNCMYDQKAGSHPGLHSIFCSLVG